MYIQNRKIADPLLTDAEYYYRRGQRPDDLTIGRVWATENAMTRIGALCFIRHRRQHHDMAAERFKNLYEGLYGSGMPAVDAGRIQVDTSKMAHDAGMAAKLDHGAELHYARQHLDKAAFDRLVALLVLGIPAGNGLSSRPRLRAVARVLADLDVLSVIFRLANEGAAT